MRTPGQNPSAFALSFLLAAAECRFEEGTAFSRPSYGEAAAFAAPPCNSLLRRSGACAVSAEKRRGHRPVQMKSDDDGGGGGDDNSERTPKADSSSSAAAAGAPRPGSLMAATLETGRVPYGEQSRKYRRTVFGHSDWVEHRDSSGRILTNLRSMLFSGIVRQLWPQVSVVACVAVAVLSWNALAIPAIDDAVGLQLPPLCLPALPFTLSSPALGLLLVFRTNASYARWMEARNTWARMVAHGRNLIRMAGTFSDDDDAVARLGRVTWLYCRTVMNQLLSPEEDEAAYREAVRDAFLPEDDANGNDGDRRLAERILSAPDRTMAAWKQLSLELHGLPVPDPKALIEADKSAIILGECTAMCEKTFAGPVPLVYTRHTARFLSLWTLLLPLALYPVFVDPRVADVPPLVQGLPTVPAASLVALFLFGIDELAMQLEEPFSILPMQHYCDKILGASETLTKWPASEMGNDG